MTETATVDCDFQLDARLLADSVFVADGPLSQIRLMNDSRFPWLVLVPRLPGLTELPELSDAQQLQLLVELNRAGRAIRQEPHVHKVNIGALGNIVPQLHIHVVGRHRDDAAWPGPVWGSGAAERFTPDMLAERVAHWRSRLG
ncbi:diadenosine tetraphosphate hydrolase [Stenotrophomonas koreensis]|uniref:Diadenosine tetraphosphate hydrolase n=1 Tax=Stenotrophomonas koreensis TaxID=266128 RepID=A0A0R0BR52_9GAMM|nr:HIT family protein [Stenotrophomonas koreensis]KRG59621.1 diadenosine tetraphosphate hydrolase [Stenotrophomonas koreensis]